MENSNALDRDPTSNTRSLPAWVTALSGGAFLVPGLCPCCIPGYLGLIASTSVGVTSSFVSSNALFAILLGLGVLPIGWQIARVRRVDLAFSAVVGSMLLIEARWVGGSVGLQILGTLILLVCSLESVRKPERVKPRSIQITKERPS